MGRIWPLASPARKTPDHLLRDLGVGDDDQPAHWPYPQREQVPEPVCLPLLAAQRSGAANGCTAWLIRGDRGPAGSVAGGVTPPGGRSLRLSGGLGRAFTAPRWTRAAWVRLGARGRP